MRHSIILFVIILCLLTAGCTPVDTGPSIEGAWITGASLNQAAAGQDLPFHISVTHKGDPIGVDFRGNLIQGNLQVVLIDVTNSIIWKETVNPGTFSVTRLIKTPHAGIFKLGLMWDGEVRAYYDLMWKPYAIEVPTISYVALLSGIGMLLVAVGFVFYGVRHSFSWLYLCWGGLAWIITVTFKFAIALKLNNLVQQLLIDILPYSLAMLSLYIYIGLLTGIFEVGFTYLILKFTRLGKAGWQKALAFGVGFGAVEALLLGVISLASVIPALMSPDLIAITTLQSISRLNNIWQGMAPVWERFFVVWIHIFSNALLFHSVNKQQRRWFGVAFIYKTLIDSVAAYGQIVGLDTLWQLWSIEIFVAIWGILGWWGTFKLEQQEGRV